jgi:ABC-type microcin C transport system permease subunit YejE
MLDDLRQQASESDYLKGLEEPVPEPPKKKNLLQQLSPMQRFVIAALLFAASLVIGLVLLLATGSIVLP